MSEAPNTAESKEGGRRNIAQTFWVSVEYVSYHFARACADNIRIMRKEGNLFAGAGLVLLGLLNWSSGKYCDGNTADYLSCTRPNTYYYYGAFQIALIILGVFLVLVWYVKNRQTK